MARMTVFLQATIAAVLLAPLSVWAQEEAGSGVPLYLDYSSSYDMGGVPTINGNFGDESGGNAVDIVDINLGFDADSILGCSGVNIGDLVQNTFNVGDIGSEFSEYLKTTLAKEALTLVYSSPAVSAVLDGLKAVGHARAGILQAKCDANEIMANARNRRLKSEGYQKCLAEHDQVYCDGPDHLAEYITEVSESPRWSGTMHDFLCDPEKENCDWLKLTPNFAYDLSEDKGKTAPAAVSPARVFDRADVAANERLRERVEKTGEMIQAQGVADTMAALSGTGTSSGTDLSGTGTAGGTGAATGGGSAWQQILGNACIDEESGKSLTDVTSMLSGNAPGEAFGDINKIIEGTAKCIIDQEVHPHVDVKIYLLPAEKREGIIRSISQAAAARASVNVMNALIFKMAETLATKGSAEGDGDNTMNQDMRNFAMMQIDNFKNMRDALVQTLQSYKDISERVAILNREVDDAQKRTTVVYPNDGR